jgi:hypothetical protein
MPVTGEAAILDYLAGHVAPELPAPPVINISNDEDDGIDWEELMAEEEE